MSGSTEAPVVYACLLCYSPFVVAAAHNRNSIAEKAMKHDTHTNLVDVA